MEVFTVAEHRNRTLLPGSFELLNLANTLKADWKSNAVIIGNDVGELGEQLARYADKVFVIEDEICTNYRQECYVEGVKAILAQVEEGLVLVSDTSSGKDFAPCLAARLNAPIQTDVVAIDVSEALRITRSILNGKILTDVALRKSNYYVLTVRQGIFKEGPEVWGSVEFLRNEAALVPRGSFVRYIEPEVGDVDISKEDILVTLGRGAEPDGSQLGVFEELARLLGGVLAGTRWVVDHGLLPADRQIGITGKVVAPKLYVGLGVSGAIQHVMGMNNSGLIIAVNKDETAIMSEVADFFIVGDVHEVVPELVRRLRSMRIMKNIES